MPAIPRIIHQAWQSKDYLKWSANLQVWRTSWTTQTDWQYNLYNDEDCLALIEASFPGLVDVYKALPTGAERADVFRYAVLHEQGGLWADLDTTCMEPLDSWPVGDCNLLVGMHGVPGGAPPWPAGFVRPAQVCQYIIAAEPKHPVFATAMREVETRVRAELKKTPKLLATADAIFNRTGMGLWTDCVLQHLQMPAGSTRWETVLGEPFDSQGIRVLPARAFAWSMEMRTLPRSQQWDRVLVRHHGLKSWSQAAPRA